MRMYDRTPATLRFDAKGLPAWTAACERISLTGLPCKQYTCPGQFTCIHHGGKSLNQQLAGQNRYIVWLLTGMPDARQLAVPVMTEFWDRIFENGLLDEEQKFLLAMALLASTVAPGNEPVAIPRRRRKTKPPKKKAPPKPKRVWSAMEKAQRQRRKQRRARARVLEQRAAAEAARPEPPDDTVRLMS